MEPLSTQLMIVNNLGLGPNNGFSHLKPYEDQKEFDSYLDNSKLAFRGGADADGNYIFEDVPNGEYYVVGWIVWRVGNEQQGGHVFKKINVQEPFTKNKIAVTEFPPGYSIARKLFIIGEYNKLYPYARH